ncbi:metal-dependent hydrolase [Legionella dresdenensis]|uniref:Metal-dependent hydrolase n=1 Tax=Legionella dresdenensis TaxID=450200 RepID=A0ABV8CH68_9GAMM
MDLITQGVLGAACAQAGLHHKDPRNAWLVGALAGMAADLDVLISSKQEPLLTMLYHRSFTHSLIFIPTGAIIVTLILLLFKRFRVQWGYTLGAALIGYATHGLLDAFTSYGTQLYWPFSNVRISWDIVSIVDPLFTIILLIGIVWTIVFSSRKGVIISLVFAALFLAFNAVQHQRALTAGYHYSAANNLHLTRVRAFPKLASSTHWRLVGQAGKDLFVADVYTPLYKASQLTPVARLPLFNNELPAFVQSSPTLMREFAIFQWFTDDYLVLASKQPFVLADGRYLSGARPVYSFWGIQFKPGENHIQRRGAIKLEDASHENSNTGHR